MVTENLTLITFLPYADTQLDTIIRTKIITFIKFCFSLGLSRTGVGDSLLYNMTDDYYKIINQILLRFANVFFSDTTLMAVGVVTTSYKACSKRYLNHQTFINIWMMYAPFML